MCAACGEQGPREHFASNLDEPVCPKCHSPYLSGRALPEPSPAYLATVRAMEETAREGEADEGDPEDAPECPKSPTGRHEPDVDTFEAATGYTVEAEGGVVYQLRCRHCHGQGSGLVALDAAGATAAAAGDRSPR